MKSKAPRMYGLMSFRMQIFQVIRENIANGLSRLFPEITMTDSYKTEELKKNKVSQKQANSELSILITNSFDFKSWGNSNREIQTHAVYTALEELVGHPGLFTSIHPIFRACTFYLAGDRFDDVVFPSGHTDLSQEDSYIPVTMGTNSFYGMLGFPEGLAQYIATTATVMVRDYVMKPEGLQV